MLHFDVVCHRYIRTVAEVVSLAAVFSIVTQRSSPLEERCVTILKTAARETIAEVNNEGKGAESAKTEVNFRQ